MDPRWALRRVGFRVSGFGFRVSARWVSGFEFRVSARWISGFGFRIKRVRGTARGAPPLSNIKITTTPQIATYNLMYFVPELTFERVPQA